MCISTNIYKKRTQIGSEKQKEVRSKNLPLFFLQYIKFQVKRAAAGQKIHMKISSPMPIEKQNSWFFTERNSSTFSSHGFPGKDIPKVSGEKNTSALLLLFLFLLRSFLEHEAG